jgi:hypothetical protein
MERRNSAPREFPHQIGVSGPVGSNKGLDRTRRPVEQSVWAQRWIAQAIDLILLVNYFILTRYYLITAASIAKLKQ